MPGDYQYRHFEMWVLLALNDEQPLPSRDSSVVDLEHPERYQSTEGSSKQRTAEEECNTESKLSTGIEEREVEYHTSEEARCKLVNMVIANCAAQLTFESAQQQTNNQHAREVLRSALEQCHRTPANHH